MSTPRPDQKNLANEIWQVAELLRGDFKRSEFGLVILPFTVLRRFECVLEPTREAVREKAATFREKGYDLDQMLPPISGQSFYNTSRYSLGDIGVAEPLANLEDYVASFSANARAVFEQFEFSQKIHRLNDDKLLYKVANYFATLDLHPDTVSNHDMGLAFEHLIRRFAESANDTAGEYFTPRDVVRLATTLVFSHDADALRGDGVIRSVYDPTCGTGGFLSSATEQINEWNPDARVAPSGQELNAQTHAIAIADMMIGREPLVPDAPDVQAQDRRPDPHRHRPERLAAVHRRGGLGGVRDPPLADGGRLRRGDRRPADRSLLQHRHRDLRLGADQPEGRRARGPSPAHRRERRELLGADAQEPRQQAARADRRRDRAHRPASRRLCSRRAQQGVPDDRLRLPPHHRRAPATARLPPARRDAPRGARRRQGVGEVGRGSADGNARGARRPRRDDHGPRQADRGPEAPRRQAQGDRAQAPAEAPRRARRGGGVLPDQGRARAEPRPPRHRERAARRGHRRLRRAEVLPHVPDAWIDRGKTDERDGQVGIVEYEIPFNRHFYVYTPPRPLAEIDADLARVSREIVKLWGEVGG